MKVVAILGSPRTNGNSATLTKRFCETAEKLGAEVQSFALQELNYSGCIACMGCKTSSEVCVLTDDLTDVLNAVADTDVLVMATAVYYADVTSQMKGFIDRTFSYLKPDFFTNPNPSRLVSGKTLVFVQTQAFDENQHTDVFPRYGGAFKVMGFSERHLIHGPGLGGPDQAAKRDDLMGLAEETAQKILG